MTDLAPLRARIASLVAARAIKARTGYAVLMGEGWTREQIDCARRRIVTVSGITKGAWWRAVPRPRIESLRELRVPRVKEPSIAPPAIQATAPKVEQPLAFPARPVARVGRCDHGFTVATFLGGRPVCELCKAAMCERGEGVA